MRIALVGHVEHITLGRVPAVPRAGDIAHLQGPRSFPGGGGGIAFFQLTRSNAEILLYTALGNDEAAAQVRARVARTSARYGIDPPTRTALGDVRRHRSANPALARSRGADPNEMVLAIPSV